MHKGEEKENTSDVLTIKCKKCIVWLKIHKTSDANENEEKKWEREVLLNGNWDACCKANKTGYCCCYWPYYFVGVDN